MAKLTSVNLSKKEQASILKSWKTCKNARTISEHLSLPNRQVMFFIESQGLSRYSEGSYR